MDDPSEARARARAVWGAGDWDAVSTLIAPVGDEVLARAELAPGMDVIDVGCGSGGTIAIPAAALGARVIGSDVTPELFEPARRRAAEAGVEVDWVEADAADLPFPDESFDRVLSTFGHAFAAEQAAAGYELVRVCRPDGRFLATMWTPEGFNGKMFATVGKHLPPPAEGFQPPIRWGTEERWEELVGPVADLAFAREELVVEADDQATYLADFEANFGPLVMARAALGDGYAALHDDLEALLDAHNEASGDALRIRAEYLLATGTPRLG